VWNVGLVGGDQRTREKKKQKTKRQMKDGKRK
jgi:hypothetical protein